MKSFATLLLLTGLLAALPAKADVISFNTQLGFVSAADLSATGTNAGFSYSGDPTGAQTDYTNTQAGAAYPANEDDYIISLFMPSTATITSVDFYDALYFDGGWFGVNGANEDGIDSVLGTTLTSSALIAPIIQVEYANNPGVWVTVDQTNNYVANLTGATVGAAYSETDATSVESTFTLTTPVSGIDGLRMVGSAGGSDYSGVGFLSGYEFNVNGTTTAPEPSTYALLFGGLGLLVLAARFRKLSA